MTLGTLDQIAARKKALMFRAEAERDSLARTWYAWQSRTVLARQVTGILTNPLFLAGFGLLAMKMPWRKTFKMSGWVWRGWKMFRTVSRMFV